MSADRSKGKPDGLPLAVASAEGLGVPVAEMLEEAASSLELEVVAGEAGLDHRVHLPRVQRPGLALTGYTDYIRYGRVQIVGSSEIGYLLKLTPRRRASILAKLCRCPITCFVVSKGHTPPRELLSAAQAAAVPVLTTPLESTTFIKLLSAFLEERLASRLHLHSVLLDVFGVGVLILGDSGIGKSECALDLIDRGHRLVADDVVEIKRMGERLVGASPDLTRYHMELRGLGVLNIRDLYGVSSVSLAMEIGLVIHLERWEEGKDYDRLGLRNESFLILGVEVPLVRMPVAPARNIALLVEVAARNQLLREGGYDAAERFVERVDALVGSGGARSRGSKGRAGRGRGVARATRAVARKPTTLARRQDETRRPVARSGKKKVARPTAAKDGGRGGKGAGGPRRRARRKGS